MNKFEITNWYLHVGQETKVRVYFVRRDNWVAHNYIHNNSNNTYDKKNSFVIRRNELNVTRCVSDDLVVAGPYPTLKAAKVAYLLMQG